MPIELKITAADTHEFDTLMARFMPQPWGTPIRITPEEPQEVSEPSRPLAEAPAIKTRQRAARTGAAIAADTATTTSTTAETAKGAPASSVLGEEPGSSGSDEHPLLVSKTLADVKAMGNKKVSELGAGPIQQLLVESFGVRNFGSLDAADLDRAYAALEALK